MAGMLKNTYPLKKLVLEINGMFVKGPRMLLKVNQLSEYIA